jgi:hypothetical protein
MVALNLDTVLVDGSAAAAGSLELPGEALEEIRVSGQALDNRDRLSPAASALYPEPGNNLVRHRLVEPG